VPTAQSKIEPLSKVRARKILPVLHDNLGHVYAIGEHHKLPILQSLTELSKVQTATKKVY